MAIVNKFNVNKQQVTLDADIIENMSANDVSYNASTQYDENTVGDKLNKLSELENYFEFEAGEDKEVICVETTRSEASSSKFAYEIKAGDIFTLSASNLRYPAYGNLIIKTYKGVSVVTYIDDFSVNKPNTASYEKSFITSGDSEGFEIGYTYANAEQPATIVVKKSVKTESKSILIEEMNEEFKSFRSQTDERFKSISEIVKTVETIVPLSIDTASLFWMRKEATNFNQNTPFEVTGSAGSKELTIIGSQKASILTVDDKYCAIVVVYDDGTATPHILQSYTDNILSVYPAIDKDVTNGIVAPLLHDSQHLTKQGYKAYMQHIYNANPRYCEKNKYIKRFDLTESTIGQFKEFSGTPGRYAGTRNDAGIVNLQYGNKGYMLIPYADYSEGKYGVYWESETMAKTGYLETYVGTTNIPSRINLDNIEKESGYELHIEVYVDGVLAFEKMKKTIYIERICVPFEKENSSVKLCVYYTNMRNQTDTIFVGSTTTWVNELNKKSLINKYDVVSQFFDSWGEFHADGSVITEYNEEFSQGASGKELHRLLNSKAGIILPFYNRSGAGMTTRWAKAWWHLVVREHQPNIMLTEFGINDYHTNQTTLPNCNDPYGNVIDMSQPITSQEFSANIKDLYEMCLLNNIQPVYIEGCIGQDMNWVIDNISAQCEQIVK